MFLGAAVMIALMADRDHDGGLIVPSHGYNASTLAQFRARAIGRHQQARRDDAGRRAQRHIDAIGARGEIRDRGGAEADAAGFARATSASIR